MVEKYVFNQFWAELTEDDKKLITAGLVIQDG